MWISGAFASSVPHKFTRITGSACQHSSATGYVLAVVSSGTASSQKVLKSHRLVSPNPFPSQGISPSTEKVEALWGGEFQPHILSLLHSIQAQARVDNYIQAPSPWDLNGGRCFSFAMFKWHIAVQFLPYSTQGWRLFRARWSDYLYV